MKHSDRERRMSFLDGELLRLLLLDPNPEVTRHIGFVTKELFELKHYWAGLS
jgi:hypothetical protein